MKFGDILRELLEDRDITQKKFSEDLGFPLSTVGNWIRYSVEPDYASLQAIADYFGVTIDYLLDHRQEEHIHTHSEDRLLRLYRSLSPDHQELFLQLGVLLWRHEHPKQAE